MLLRRMRKRTSLLLDMDLVHDAAAALGTSTTTATVHEALREAAARAARERLASEDFEDLTLEGLEQMRRSRARA
jgi:Arc/MetJ family transcription regulator